MTINVTPINDLKPHTDDHDCPCRPRIEQHGDHFVVIHNSYDGREITERAIADAVKFGAAN